MIGEVGGVASRFALHTAVEARRNPLVALATICFYRTI